jgi:hypothetical protein
VADFIDESAKFPKPAFCGISIKQKNHSFLSPVKTGPGRMEPLQETLGCLFNVPLE